MAHPAKSDSSSRALTAGTPSALPRDMNTNLNVAGLKKWAAENKGAADTVILATAFAQTERERVAAYALDVFNGFEFYADDDGENGARITNPERLYLSKDDEQSALYYAAMDTAHRLNGFDGPEGHCPALVAEDLQRQAEDVLLASLGEFVGVDGRGFSRSLDMRAKALDLALSSCLAKEIV